MTDKSWRHFHVDANKILAWCMNVVWLLYADSRLAEELSEDRTPDAYEAWKWALHDS